MPNLLGDTDNLVKSDRVLVECTPNDDENLQRFNLAPASAPGKVAVTGSVIDLDGTRNRIVIMPDRAPESLGIDRDDHRVVGLDSGVTVGTDAHMTLE